jgi:hypothetical protein
LLPTRFEITKVEPSIFMLKAKDSNTELVGTLEKWLRKNYSMGESGYGNMLWKRSGSTGRVLSECITSDFIVDQIDITESIVGVGSIRDESVCDEYAIRQLMFIRVAILSRS